MASKDYIVSIDNKSGNSTASGEVIGDLKKIVEKFDGTVKHELSLIHGFHVSVPDHLSDKFKESLEFWSLGADVNVNVEPDQQVKAL